MALRKNVAKCLLLFLNIMLLLCGAALIGVGVYVKLGHVSKIENSDLSQTGLSDSEQNYLKQWVRYAPLSLICFGSFVFVISFLGCQGASKENRCLLGTYLTFIFVILVCELAVGSYALANRDSLDDFAGRIVNATWVHDKDLYQSVCGSSCPCVPEKECTSTDPATCPSCVEERMKDNIDISGAMLLAICFVEILLLVLACCLFRALRSHNSEKVPLKGSYGKKMYTTR